MKIVFLDIDGVLNNELFYRERYEKMKSGKYDTPYPYSEIDPKSIEYLSDICEKTSCKIVISSTWRLGRMLDELIEIFNYFGFKGDIISVTPSLNSDSVRGNEIRKWINQNYSTIQKHNHEFDSYVILDDDSDMLLEQKDNFICVDRFTGLTENDVLRSIEILNKKG